MQTIIMTQPDDMHCHLRDDDLLSLVVPHTSQQFARAVVMPNLAKPITTVKQAEQYRQRIVQAIPEGTQFEPLMILYLTETTTVEEIKKAAECEFVHAIKYYPAGATTNSDSGVKEFSRVYPQLEAMQKYNLPLLIHGEVVEASIDIFDREKVFIDQILAPLVKDMPGLKIVFEHMTTKNAVDFVTESTINIAATITPQHLLYNRNQLLVGGIKPHYYCLPILKSERHRQALNIAATSGNPKFFAGTDSAPHLQGAKESSCGCAGCYSAPFATELYAKAFEQENALDKLEAFMAFYGADFYGIARNKNKITLTKKSQNISAYYDTENGKLIPLDANQKLEWSASLS